MSWIVRTRSVSAASCSDFSRSLTSSGKLATARRGPGTLGLVEARAPTVPVASAPPASLVGRARFLARLGLAWHLIEATVAVGAGIAASSIALIGFGADSLVESVAGVVVLWRFSERRLIPSAPNGRRSA